MVGRHLLLLSAHEARGWVGGCALLLSAYEAGSFRELDAEAEELRRETRRWVVETVTSTRASEARERKGGRLTVASISASEAREARMRHVISNRSSNRYF